MSGVDGQEVTSCNKCSEKQPLLVQNLCDACPIHQQVQETLSRAKAELEIRQNLDTPKEFKSFCRSRLTQSIEVAVDTIISPAKPILQYFALGNATYDEHRDHIIARALGTLYRTGMGYQRTNSGNQLQISNITTICSEPFSQVTELKKYNFADYLLDYTVEELLIFLKKFCLLGQDNKANPSAETAAWTAAIQALADFNPPKIVGTTAALTKAFMTQFSINASFSTMQRRDTNKASRYYGLATALLNK